MRTEGKEEKHRQFSERYAEGDVPWDDDLPPPELRAAVASRPPGRALDLGCGYGRAAIYLARQGWHVDAIDFVTIAIEEAKRRAAATGAEVSFHVADVTDLSFLHKEYDLALDVGCAHSLKTDELRAFSNEVSRLLRSGGLFLLFARIATDGNDEGPSGINEDELQRFFGDDFELSRYERGITEMENGESWVSAWYWFVRR